MSKDTYLTNPDNSLLIRLEVLKTKFTILQKRSSANKAKSTILIEQAHTLILRSQNLEFKSEEIDPKMMKNRCSFNKLST
jgi:hypothetical protein